MAHRYVEGSAPRTRSLTRPIFRPATWRTYRRFAVAACDAAAFVIAIGAVDRLEMFGRGQTLDIWLVVLGAGVWTGIFALFGLTAISPLPATEEIRRVIGASGVAAVAVMVLASRLDVAMSPAAVGVLWTVAVTIEFTCRGLARWQDLKLTATGQLNLRTLVVGADEEAIRLGLMLRARSDGVDPFGFVTTPSQTGDTADLDPSMPVVGELDELEDLIDRYDVECLFVVPACLSETDMTRVFHIARVAGAEVRLSASVPGTLPSRITLTNHGSATALSLRPVKLLGPSSVFKRALDIVASVLAITILCVPALILMAMIRLSSPGPALFRQRRGTVGGRRFTIYKFRTMVDIPDAGIDPTAPFYKAEDDPRITRLGAFLRRYSIDEFPQFLNVLKGDISLVGPRPLMAEQVDNLPAELVRQRGEVKAGITGWWQINGRSHVSPEEALRLDTFYIENWSFSLDLYILVKTVKTVLLRQGAY